MHYFRKYMQHIVIFMIACFLLTLGAGLGVNSWQRFMNRNTPNTVDRQNAIATVGEIVVPVSRFQERYNRALNQAGKDISPQNLELIRLDAFNKAVRFVLMLQEANKSSIKVRGSEVRKYLNTLALNSGLKDRGQVKKTVERQGGNWSTFKDSIEDDIRVNKFIQALQNGVVIKQQDIDDYFTQVKARHILIKFDPNKYSVAQVASAEENQSKTQLQQLRQQISSGALTFADAAKKYSQDEGSRATGGDLGYFGHGVMDPEFERVTFALSPGEISPPVKSAFGYHLILVEDRRQTERSADATDEKIRNTLMGQKQQDLLDKMVANYETQVFDIKDPWIKAIRDKLQGDYPKALTEYQLWSAQASVSPLPDYFIAQMQTELKNYPAAEVALKKAELKQSFKKDGPVFPEIWMAFGDLYKAENKPSDALAAYAKASEKSPDRLDIHQALVERYKDVKNSAKAKIEQNLVNQLQAKQPPAPAPSAAAATPPRPPSVGTGE